MKKIVSCFIGLWRWQPGSNDFQYFPLQPFKYTIIKWEGSLFKQTAVITYERSIHHQDSKHVPWRKRKKRKRSDTEASCHREAKEDSYRDVPLKELPLIVLRVAWVHLISNTEFKDSSALQRSQHAVLLLAPRDSRLWWEWRHQRLAEAGQRAEGLGGKEPRAGRVKL